MADNETKIVQAAWRTALAGQHGEIIIKDLKLYADRQSHVVGDPYSTAFNDGMRVMAKNILLTIEGEDDVPHETKVLR